MSETTKMHGRKGNGHRGKERSKGAGTLEKRGRVYIARWTVEGHRYSQSTGTSDRREAEARLAEFVAPFQLKDKAERLEAFAGKLEGVEGRLKELEDARPTLALDDAWEAFLKSPNRPDTAGAVRLHQGEARYRAFVEFMRERHPEVGEVRAVTKDHAQEYAMSHATTDMTRHYYHESQGALVAAVTALPDVVRPGTGASTTDAATPRVKALCAALDALDAQERELVLRHLQGAGRAASVALVPCAPESALQTMQYPLVPVAAA